MYQILKNQRTRLLRYLLFTVLWLGSMSHAVAGITIVINELDADTPGTDAAEFIELYDGGSGTTPLDGLVLVLYNGSTDLSYAAFDLDGQSTDAQGYFVLCGNNANTANCDLDVTPNTDLIQNGQDAAALFFGDAVDFPTNTAVTTTDLIDAIVYDTSDADDAGLLVLLNPGQPQVDENSNAMGATQSNQRCPNGAGGARNTSTYLQAAISPGVTNTCPGAATDLSISVADTPDPVTAGMALSYAVEVSNLTATAADTVNWSTTLAAGTTFQSLTAPGGWSCTTPAVGSAGAVNCSIATLAGMAVANFSLNTTTDPGLAGGSILNLTAGVTTTTNDTNLANNEAIASTTVNGVVVGTAFTIADASLVEGNAGTTNLQFTVTATPAPGSSTTVDFASTGGTAASGIDFTAANGTLTFAKGVATQVVNVPVAGDNTVEANETLTVTLSNPSAGTIGMPGSATGTINNDDSAVISLNAPSVAEGNVGTTPLPFVLSISNPVQGAVSLDYASADGNNVDPLLNATTADNDYAATNGTVSFPSDSTANLTVNVSVNGDTKVEPNQGLRLNLSNLVRPAGIDAAALTLAATTGNGTINDDDGTTVSVAPTSVTEGNAATSNLVFTVSLSNPSKTPVTVNYTTTGVTATNGNDFTAATGTVTFPPNNQSQTVTVLVNGDLVVEANETVSLTLSAPVGALLGTGTATGTINNDDSATLSLNTVNQAEGNAGNSPMNFTATLSAPVQGTVTASATTADGNNANPLLNATVADNDYVALNNAPVSIATGTTATIPVQIVGDTDVEPNQGLRLTLSNLVAPAGIPAGAITLGTAGAGTINNDDGATMNIAGNSIVEGNAGTSVLNFTVSLTATNKDPVTVNFATANGTATAGSDYVANSGVLTFPANTLSQTIAVTINGDTLLESDETFTVTLSGATGATLGTAVATGTITNDDTAALSVADASTIEGNTNIGLNRLSFVVSLIGNSASPITVNYTTSSGTAMAVLDYTTTSGTLTFAPGETSKTVNVPVTPDMVPEDAETLTFTLSNPNPAQVTLTRATATGTINNDDFVSQIPVNNRLALALLLLLIGSLGLWAVRRR